MKKTSYHNIPARLIGLLLCFSLMFTMFAWPGATPAEAKTLAELENEIKELEDQKKEIDGQLAETEDNIANEKERQKALSSQIKNLESQISVYTTKINTLNQEISKKDAEIEQKTKEIEETQAQIDKNYELFKKRVKAMYMSDDATTLGVLFGSQTFAEFLTAVEVSKRVAEHDRELIDTLTQQKKAVEDAKAEIVVARQEIEADRAQVQADKAELDKKNRELNAAYQQSQQSQHSLEELSKKYNKDREQIEKEMQEAQELIDSITSSTDDSQPIAPGAWCWPVPGRTYISSYYGNREPDGGVVTAWHKGIDIPAPIGTPICAAKSGKVIDARFSTSYGYMIIIDHGGGFTSLYAHNSSLAVSNGQWVSSGDVIAYAGDTGYVTGPHLHFEVRVNGQTQDPLLYIPRS